MQTTLCFDFGNTRIKCAVFEDNNLKDVFVLQNDEDATILRGKPRVAPTL